MQNGVVPYNVVSIVTCVVAFIVVYIVVDFFFVLLTSSCSPNKILQNSPNSIVLFLLVFVILGVGENVEVENQGINERGIEGEE